MMLLCFLCGVMSFITTGVRCEVAEVLVAAGSQAVLPCKCSRSSSSIPPAIIWTKSNSGTVWRKQRNGLQFWGSSWMQTGSRVRCPHSQFEKGDYSLQINSVREEDGGLYICRVEHGQRITETFVRLRIIKVSVSSAVAVWGSDVTINCTVTPWRIGASVEWRLNNSPFVSLNGLTQSKGQIGVKEKATDRLSGNWTCVVGYGGTEGRASAALSVQGIIQPSTDNTQVFAAVGSGVTLPCVFSPGLTPVNVVWEKLASGSTSRLPPSFSPSSAQPLSDKSVSSHEVSVEDAGRYRCAGTVDKQTLTRDMQLVIAKIVSSKKKDSVVLTCQLTDTSGVTEYEWVQLTHDVNGTESTVSVQRGKTLRISQEESRGQWMCRFYGTQGILGNVTYEVPMMAGLSGHKSSGHSHNTATVVGLSFLLLVLLLILAQMYKNHQRRKRILPYPALETIVHTISNEREEREKHRGKK